MTPQAAAGMLLNKDRRDDMRLHSGSLHALMGSAPALYHVAYGVARMAETWG